MQAKPPHIDHAEDEEEDGDNETCLKFINPPDDEMQQ
jgi:hypothetical protein